ncbi:DUF3324 domain-containing protein [Bacillus sp. CHD6a]|uniref:DUF3324 domain-containing protein n=1 Tax=Bacillus sp. CHD6a TaxID=1643452 RepID=UPI0006CD5A78|nr:DUF3324 domain-containing protein [Bacillus sp. CHD6a]KPB03069.1 hypothetical protein AAV98_19205 [Bacillus sp. CHD6a]
MKKILVLLSVLLVFSMVVFITFKWNVDEVVKMDSKLEFISESEGIKTYEFSVKPLQQGETEIRFHLKNDISIVLEKMDVDIENISQESLIYEIPNREKGEKVVLKPDEELKYPIGVDLNKLTQGTYKLSVNFSAENVEVAEQSVEIVVE